MGKYFDKFPTITYNKNPVKNILTRVTFDSKTKKTPESFVDHKLNDDTIRADQIAHRYYENSKYDWLYHFTNNIIDPYYDSFLDSESLIRYIQKKYISLAYAREFIVYYINNWASEENSTISTANYDLLPLARKKYFDPVVDYYNQVTGYIRKRQDNIVSTNKIVGLKVDDSEIYSIGDIFSQYSGGDHVAKGQLVGVDKDNKIFYLNCITGTFTTDEDNYIIGKHLNKLYRRSVTEILTPSSQDNISPAESIYWTPITAYEHEVELNEKKRNIILLRKSLRSKAEEELMKMLRS